MYGYVAPQQDRMAEAHDHSANMATASDPPTVAPSHLDSAFNRFTGHKKATRIPNRASQFAVSNAKTKLFSQDHGGG